MTFAIALPAWALALLVIVVATAAWASYAGAIVPLSRRRRATLIALRALTLLLLVVCLLGPARVLPPDSAGRAVVPILVDGSRSMGVSDAAGRRRIDAAAALVRERLAPALDAGFVQEIWTFGDALVRRDDRAAPSAPAGSAGEWLPADDRRSDLSAALREVRERYRERRVAGIVVISDGGDTGPQDAALSLADGTIPVFAIGIGSARVEPDLELLELSSGERTQADSSIDLSVTAVNRGSAEPFDLRVLENGRAVDLRRVTPAAPGSPVRAVFTVTPPRAAALYTIEIPSATGEVVLENNRRSVIVAPPGRVRRVLMIEGAPGFEHSFLKRAVAADPGIELDSVVRKGHDDRGEPTYFVSASADRGPRLASGFPNDRATLYAYDAVIIANVEPDTLARAQLDLLAGFVGERGGGLLVLGARSFAQQGLAGTALEEVLPVALSALERSVRGIASTSRRQGAAGADAARAAAADLFAVRLTPEGAAHPVMRIGATPEETVKRWAAVPSLAGASAFAATRPGAQVLALVGTVNGDRPLIAVQRYGHGRSMVFAGEASWRWRMRMPSSERTYELFWRQSARWLTAATPDRISVAALPPLVPGDTAAVTVEVRDDEFAPVTDAVVSVHVTTPDGRVAERPAVLLDAGAARYVADVRFEQAGVYRVSAAVGGGGPTASAERWMVVGGADREMTEPRLHEEVLRRVARASGGSYLAEADIAQLPALLESARVVSGVQRVEPLWHSAWIFLLVIALLTIEWLLRRRWGLR